MKKPPHLTAPNMIIPTDPGITPADNIANGSPKLPEPILALAKLKKVPITL